MTSVPSIIKHRPLKRPSLMRRIKKVVDSRSKYWKGEEESNGSRKKKQRRDGDDLEQRNSDLCISSSSPSSSSYSPGNVLTSNDNTHFDVTADGLLVSYSNKSKRPYTPTSSVETTKKKAVSSEEGNKAYHVKVKGPTFKDLGGVKGCFG